MNVKLTHEMAYVPRVTQTHGGHEGVSFGPGTVNYGFLCLTVRHLYYIPEQVLNMQRLGSLTARYRVSDRKITDIDGVRFTDVVPAKLKQLGGAAGLDAFLSDLASEIPGSFVLSLADIAGVKIGFFAQLTLVTQQRKVRFAVGGKKVRETLREFLARHVSHAPEHRQQTCC